MEVGVAREGKLIKYSLRIEIFGKGYVEKFAQRHVARIVYGKGSSRDWGRMRSELPQEDQAFRGRAPAY